jgi:hypothetical protein
VGYHREKHSKEAMKNEGKLGREESVMQEDDEGVTMDELRKYDVE